MQYLHEEIEVRVNCFQFVLFSVLPSVEFVALFENREKLRPPDQRCWLNNLTVVSNG